MVKNMKRKEMKNENENTLAAMGIGAMIVFIALILVAAVASAVNDALRPLDIEINELPIRARDIETALYEKSK